MNVGLLGELGRKFALAQMILGALRLSGWLRSDGRNIADLVDALLNGGLAEVLRQYQRFHGLPDTGELDGPTKKAILAPRFCGVPDVLSFAEDAGALPAWPKGEVRWWCDNPNGFSGLSSDEALSAIDRAWSDFPTVCGLKVRNVSRMADANCVMRAAPIDGPLGTLAWSELADNTEGTKDQQYDGDGERWSFLDSDRCPPGTISLPTVVRHEGMHLVGISHAPRSSGALIAPAYSARVPTFTAYDIRELRDRYGDPKSTGPVPVDPTGQGKITVPCEIDLVTGTFKFSGIKVSKA